MPPRLHARSIHHLGCHCPHCNNTRRWLRGMADTAASRHWSAQKALSFAIGQSQWQASSTHRTPFPSALPLSPWSRAGGGSPLQVTLRSSSFCHRSAKYDVVYESGSQRIFCRLPSRAFQPPQEQPASEWIHVPKLKHKLYAVERNGNGMVGHKSKKHATGNSADKKVQEPKQPSQSGGNVLNSSAVTAVLRAGIIACVKRE